VISRALEKKTFLLGILFDVVQTFDKVWHKGFYTKLPHTWCALLESYLTNRQFQVIYVEAVTKWKEISAGVPKVRALGPVL